MSNCLRAHRLQPARFFLCPWDFLGKNTGVGCHFLFHGIFPTQGSNSSLLHLLYWQADSLPIVPLGKPKAFRDRRQQPQAWCQSLGRARRVFVQGRQGPPYSLGDQSLSRIRSYVHSQCDMWEPKGREDNIWMGWGWMWQWPQTGYGYLRRIRMTRIWGRQVSASGVLDTHIF